MPEEACRLDGLLGEIGDQVAGLQEVARLRVTPERLVCQKASDIEFAFDPFEPTAGGGGAMVVADYDQAMRRTG